MSKALTRLMHESPSKWKITSILVHNYSTLNQKFNALSLFLLLFLEYNGLWLEFMKPNFRRCISCRKVAPKEEFWRIVRIYPSQEIQLDQGMGRSAYLCRNSDCLTMAQKKNRLGRSLKTTVAPEIYQTLWERLLRTYS
jgi:uncharacterized protein